MPSQWKKNKKRKNKPTPSPTYKEAVTKKIKQTDTSFAETQSESGESGELTDSLPYLKDTQDSKDSVDSRDISQPPSTTQSQTMNTVTTASAESAASTITDESFFQSQPGLQDPAAGFGDFHSSTPAQSMHSGQSLGQVPMPFLQSQMIGMAPTVHNTGFPSQMPIIQTSISDNDVLRVAIKVKDLMREEIESLVNIKVNEATRHIKNDIKNLQDENLKLKNSIQKLENRCNNNLDDLEQYGRRMNVRIAGINEDEEEDTDQVVIDFAKRINVNIRPDDIDRCHRVKRREREPNPNVETPFQDDARPLEIIVKFTNSKARLALMKGRATLRRSKSNVFINEDLTAGRKELTYECRKLRRANKISRVWTYNGNVYIKDNNDTQFQIYSKTDLEGY